MSMKISEKEFSDLIKNTKISINKDNSIKNKKILITPENQKDKKNSAVDINKVIKSIKDSTLKYSVSENHVTIVLDGAILLSINQIFAFLQRQKKQFAFFSYKKEWHNKIKDVLTIIKYEKMLPFFEENVEITLLRQAKRDTDLDAIVTMFKFIIDGLKRSDDNPLGVLSDDNPKVIHTINFSSQKGEPLIGISLKKTISPKSDIDINDFLNT